jgi:Ca2+-binding RTX toxin-like protein
MKGAGARGIHGILASLAGLAIAAAPAAAKPGDLIVGDSDAGAVLRIDPNSGAQSLVADDSAFGSPDGIAFDARGNTFVVDYGADAVFRIGRNGGVSTVASGAPFTNPSYIDYSPDRNLYVADQDADTLFNLDPGGGEPAPFSADVAVPFSVEVAHDASLFASGTDGVFRVDRVSGDATDIAPGLFVPGGLTLAPDGILYMADGFESVFRIDPKARSFSALVDESAEIANAYDVAVHPNGFLYLVSTQGGVGTIQRLDPATGALTEIASESDPGALLDFPEGIEVQPPKCKGRVANIVGSEKNDKLKGSKFPDVIAGLGGKDKIKGVKGNDRLCGGKGKDKLKGGPGKDKLLGQGGKDKLDGGPGKDKERQ